MSEKKTASDKGREPTTKRSPSKSTPKSPSHRGTVEKPASESSQSNGSGLTTPTADHVPSAIPAMTLPEISQPELSESSQLPAHSTATHAPATTARPEASEGVAKPAATLRRVLDVFLVDSGWSNEVGNAIRENLPVFAGYLQGQRFYVLNEAQSLEFIRRHPALVGADPILVVLDRESARRRNPKGYGFRLCLGHMRNPEGAISMLKWAIQLSMASNGPEMATIVRESGHRQTIQGTIELIGEGSAHLLEFAPV